MIPGLPAEASRAVIDLLTEETPIRQAFLYGSRAKGNFRPGSDIDLCLDAPELDFSSLVRFEDRLDDLMLPWRFDVSIRQQIDNPALLDHIDRVGIPLLSTACSGSGTKES